MRINRWTYSWAPAGMDKGAYAPWKGKKCSFCSGGWTSKATFPPTGRVGKVVLVEWRSVLHAGGYKKKATNKLFLPPPLKKFQQASIHGLTGYFILNKIIYQAVYKLK
jgi:hypothetical protein